MSAYGTLLLMSPTCKSSTISLPNRLDSRKGTKKGKDKGHPARGLNRPNGFRVGYGPGFS
jgi:hypothetical protein